MKDERRSGAGDRSTGHPAPVPYAALGERERRRADRLLRLRWACSGNAEQVASVRRMLRCAHEGPWPR